MGEIMSEFESATSLPEATTFYSRQVLMKTTRLRCSSRPIRFAIQAKIDQFRYLEYALDETDWFWLRSFVVKRGLIG
jgi:hypothetical protein